MAYAEEVLKPGQSIKPVINAEDCQVFIERLYGLKCSCVEQLNGYDDLNFKVTVENNENTRECVFKIMNSLDSGKLLAVEAQCALLSHLRSNGIPCQKVLKNLKGQYYSVETLKSGNHVVRLLEYLPGYTLHQVPTSPSLLYEAGKFIAKLDCAAQPFYHQGYLNYKSIWLLEEISNISKFLFAVSDVNTKQIVEEVIEDFNKRVLPIKDNLEKGLIHGDFNEQNIIVQKFDEQWHITGVLDFGDAHFDCYLFELAIAVTYMVLVHKDLDAAGYVIAGYASLRKPTVEEFSLLKICVAARLCQSIVYAAYSILQDPGNSYILVTAPSAEALLRELWPLEEEELLHKWKAIADGYPST